MESIYRIRKPASRMATVFFPLRRVGPLGWERHGVEAKRAIDRCDPRETRNHAYSKVLEVVPYVHVDKERVLGWVFHARKKSEEPVLIARNARDKWG